MRFVAAVAANPMDAMSERSLDGLPPEGGSGPRPFTRPAKSPLYMHLFERGGHLGTEKSLDFENIPSGPLEKKALHVGLRPNLGFPLD